MKSKFQKERRLALKYLNANDWATFEWSEKAIKSFVSGMLKERSLTTEKQKDHSDGWWLALSIEELREEFACLEELECENQAAVAEFGAHCLEKSTDGIYALGNLLEHERTLRQAAETRAGELEQALKYLDCKTIYRKVGEPVKSHTEDCVRCNALAKGRQL